MSETRAEYEARPAERPPESETDGSLALAADSVGGRQSAPQYSRPFRCLACGATLAWVRERKGRTVLTLYSSGSAMWGYRVEVECPRCGEVRRFNSDPVSAVRLGLSSM